MNSTRTSRKQLLKTGRTLFDRVNLMEKQIKYLVIQLYKVRPDHQIFIDHPENIPTNEQLRPEESSPPSEPALTQSPGID